MFPGNVLIMFHNIILLAKLLTKAQVHPLLAQIHSDLTRGTDETKHPEERQIDRYLIQGNPGTSP